MKKVITIFLTLVLTLSLAVPAFAVEPVDPKFTFDLTAVGEYTNPHDIEVETNDIVTVRYSLSAATSDGCNALTQDEIYYDTNFFEYVEGSAKPEMVPLGDPEAEEVDGFDIGHHQRLDNNWYVFFNNGSSKYFDDDMDYAPIGTFQLKVIATTGSSTIQSTNFGAKTLGNVPYKQENFDLRVTIAGSKADANVTISGYSDKTYGDSNFTLTATAADKEQSGGTWNWTVDNSGTFEIVGSDTGSSVNIKILKANTTGAKITATYDDASYSGSDDVTIKVDPASITTATAVAKNWTGEELTPELTVKAGNLTCDTDDYTVGSWSGNLIDIGDYKATVTGKGNFTGTKEVTFTINPKGTATAPKAVTGLAYTGGEQEGVAGGTGYTVTNGKKTNAGSYTATATLEDGYEWSDGLTADKTISWSIAPASITTATAVGQEYTGSELTPVLTVKAGSLDATYDLSDWSDELKNIGTYTATVTGKGNFTGTKEVTFTINPKGTASTPQAVNGLAYTGEELVGVPGGIGYTVTGGKATNAGNYTATAKLDAGYKWSDGTTADKTIKWSIGKASITNATAASQPFTGSELTPSLTVNAGELTCSTNDYTVGSWSGQLKKPGTYTATVTGKGNYTGSKTVSFTITHEHGNVNPIDGQEPEEFTPGYRDYFECECGDFFEDEECTTPITNLDAWKAKGGRGYIERTHQHGDTEYVPGVEPQGLQSGYKSCYKCSCGEYFEDEACTKPIRNYKAWKSLGGGGYIASKNLLVTIGATVVSVPVVGSIVKWIMTRNDYSSVEFDMQGHGDAIADYSVKNKSTIDAPATPVAEGYEFGGWFKEAGCINAWNFANDQIKGDTTLFAKWTKVQVAPVEPVDPVYEKKSVLLLTAKTSGNKAVKLSWTGVEGADKYDVYGSKCGGEFVKITTTDKKNFTVKKVNGKALVAHGAYKYYVIAYTDDGQVRSKTIHFITANTKGKYANVKTLKAKKTELTLAVGETAKVGAKYTVIDGKKHIGSNHGKALRFLTDCPEVASVNADGVVTANAAGTATIYIQDIGSKYVKTVVTVE